MALITGPSAADLVLNDRVFRHLPLIELDEVIDRAQGRLLARLVGAPDERRVVAAVPPPAREARTCRSSSRAAGSTRTRARTCASSRRSATGVPNRVLMGPWSHEEEVETFTGDVDLAPASVTVIREHELVFYDRFLKEADNDWDERPPLELFVLGANEWRGEHEWPLARTEFTPWYLGSGGRANTLAGDGTLGPGEPGAASRRPLLVRPGGSRADDRRRQLGADDDAGRRDADPARARATSACSSAATTCSVTRASVLDRDLEVDRAGRDGALRRLEREGHRLHRAALATCIPNGKSIFMTEGIIRARYRNSARGRLGRAARAGRGGRVPDPLLPDRERVQARATGCGST